MANGHGGKRNGAGRKSKAEEFGLAALLDECWTVDQRKAVIKALHEQAADGVLGAAELLLAYAYGRPRQTLDVGVSTLLIKDE